jgi:NADPH:quinone reductase-like Zn-dependent oxidoreductase
MTTKTMRALEATDFSIDALKLGERPLPKPSRGEILAHVKAASLNYRNLAILGQKYLPALAFPSIPASDACGEVVEVGEEVTRFKVGVRATPTYTQGRHDRLPTQDLRTKRTLGAPLSDVLQEYIAVPAEGAVSAPAHLSDGEAATPPIAAVTAWSSLHEGGINPGDTVLVQGTGGVALSGPQFAKLSGARNRAFVERR